MTKQQRRIAGGAAVVVVVLIGVGVAIASGGGDDNPVDTTASTSTTAATLPATTTTVAPTSVTVGIICTTPEDAAQTVVSAWEANDKPAAARCANQSALDELFKASGVGASWMFQGCGGPDPGVPTCQFSYEGGAANFAMAGTDAAGWKVDTVSYIAD